MLAAIEIYNKPQITYRDEVFLNIANKRMGTVAQSYTG